MEVKYLLQDKKRGDTLEELLMAGWKEQLLNDSETTNWIMCSYVKLTENASIKLDSPQQLLPKVPIQLLFFGKPPKQHYRNLSLYLCSFLQCLWANPLLCIGKRVMSFSFPPSQKYHASVFMIFLPCIWKAISCSC